MYSYIIGIVTGYEKNSIILENNKIGYLINVGNPYNYKIDDEIKVLNNKEEPIVFILWGNFAKEKKELITNSNHLVLMSPHPSPFSANSGFFGSKPFSKINDYLKNIGKEEIMW